MLDPSTDTRLLETVEGKGVGPVADRVHRERDALCRSDPDGGCQFGDVLGEHAVIGGARVGVVTQCRPGVERPVDEHLARADRHQSVGTRERVTGALPGGERVLQQWAEDGRLHPDREPLGRQRGPTGPLVMRVDELEVPDPGDAACGSRVQGFQCPPVERPLRGLRQRGHRPEAVVLLEQAGRMAA